MIGILPRLKSEDDVKWFENNPYDVEIVDYH